jgi:hypothetical protein
MYFNGCGGVTPHGGPLPPDWETYSTRPDEALQASTRAIRAVAWEEARAMVEERAAPVEYNEATNRVGSVPAPKKRR